MLNIRHTLPASLLSLALLSACGGDSGDSGGAAPSSGDPALKSGASAGQGGSSPQLKGTQGDASGQSSAAAGSSAASSQQAAASSQTAAPSQTAASSQSGASTPQAEINALCTEGGKVSAPAQVSGGGVRGDVLAAVLLQNYGSDAKPVVLNGGKPDKSGFDQVYPDLHKPLNGHQQVSQDAQSTLGQFALSTQTAMTPAEDNRTSTSHALRTRIGLTPVQGSLRESGQLMIVGNQLLWDLDSNQKAGEQTFRQATLTLQAREAINIRRDHVYGQETIQTWEGNHNGLPVRVTLSVSGNSVAQNDRSFPVCIDAVYGDAGNDAQKGQYFARRVCSWFKVPEGWSVEKPILPVRMIVDEDRYHADAASGGQNFQEMEIAWNSSWSAQSSGGGNKSGSGSSDVRDP